MFSDGDEHQGVVLGVLFGVIALVIGLVIGLGVYQTRLVHRRAAPPAALVVPVVPVAGVAVVGPGGVAAAAVPGMPSGVAVEIAVVKVFFEPGQATLPPGASEALSRVAQEVVAGKSVSIGAYHDSAGDAARNAEIARQRASSVRDLLASLGVPPDRMEMQKPEAVSGVAAADARTRQVDVRVR